MTTPGSARCRQRGATYDPEANHDQACRYHAGDRHEGSGFENYEPDWWDCQGECVRIGPHVASGARDPAYPEIEIIGPGAARGVFQQRLIRIGAHPRSDIRAGRGDEYTYLRLWWDAGALWVEGCGSLHWYHHNDSWLEPRTPTRLASGDRLTIDLGPAPFEVRVCFDPAGRRAGQRA